MRNLNLVLSLTVVASLMVVSTASAKRLTDSATQVNAGGPTLVHGLDGPGHLSMNSDPMITTWEMKSDAGLFNCDNIDPASLDPFFGTCGPDKIFTTWPSGSGALNFGAVWTSDYATLLTDIDQDGSLVGGGGLDRDQAAAPYANNVPEPASITLLGIGLLGLMGLRRKNK